MTTSRFPGPKRNVPLIAASALCLISMSTQSFAQGPTTKVASSATGLIVNLGIASLVGLSVGTDPMTSGEATAGPPAVSSYAKSGSVAKVTQGLGLGTTGNLTLLGIQLPVSGAVTQGVKTGLISQSASGNFPTGATATATVNNLALDLSINLPVVGATTLLGVGSSVISSTTTFNGTSLIGTSNIANLNLSTLLPFITIGATGNVNAAPNTQLLTLLNGLTGISIIANEQISSQSFSPVVLGHNEETDTLTTNALHISFDHFLLGNKVLTGDIIVGQSSASFTQAIPEASTWAMMIIGLGGLGASLRMSNRRKLRGQSGLDFWALQAA